MKLFLRFAVVLAGVAGHAHANIYLQTLHNNTNEFVQVSATLPDNWVDTPKYPLIVWPHYSLFDTTRMFGVNWVDKPIYKFQYQLMRNVGVPLGGRCTSDPNRLLIEIGSYDIDKKKFVPKSKFRVYDCDWQVHVDKYDSRLKKWVETKNGVDVPVGQFKHLLLQSYVDDKGNFKLSRDKSIHYGDKYKCQRNYLCPKTPFYPLSR